MQKDKKQKYSQIFQIAALFLLAAGLPLSVFLMSLGTISLLVAFLADGNFSKKLKQLKKEPVFLSLASLFIIHLAGLIYTTDFKYAFNDIKIKIPLLVFPLAFITLPRPGIKTIRYILLVFLAATFISTFHAFLVYREIIPTSRDISDVRNITVFISHVRLALIICIAIYILIYDAFYMGKTNKITAGLLFTWFIYFLYILESGTGFLILFISGILVLIAVLLKFTSRTVRITSAVVITCSLFFLFISVKNIVYEYYTPRENLNNLELITSNGNPYYHDFDFLTLENGYYVGLYQCRKEMIPAWNEKSEIPFDSLDKKGQRISFTLMRYLTSKGLRKDAEGVSRLNAEDVKNIENGIANVDYVHQTGMRRRIEQILFEFDNYLVTSKAGGNSLTQRIEYWKTGWSIFIQHPVFGVGTGDAQLEFNHQYEIQKSNLPEEHRHRSHNQFLAFMVTFGIPGLIIFLFVLFIPLIKAFKENNTLYLLFFICLVISFFSEDTLETQAGVTLFAFFHCFLLYYEENKVKKINSSEAVRQPLQV